MINNIDINYGMGGPVLQNTNMSNIAATNVVLYLFSRKTLPQQYRRPYLLSFGGSFDRAVSDKLAQANTVGSWRYSDMFMRDNAIALGSILPDTSATPINTTPFQESWTFMLIIDHTASSSPWESTVGSTPYRDIYTGFIQDEPIKRDFMGVSANPNPHAIFVTTHYTKLACQMVMMSAGMSEHVEVQADKDLLPGETIQMIQTQPNSTVYDLRPETLSKSVTSDPYGGDAYSIHASPVVSGEQNKPSIAVDTSLNSPVHYLANVVSGIATAAKYMSGPFSQQQEMDVFGGTDVAMSTLSSQLSHGMINTIGIMDPALPFQMQELINQYPMIKIQTINQPVNTPLDLYDNGGNDQKAIMTSLISNALPSLLVQYKMMDISFVYSSTQHDETEPPGIMGLMGVQSVTFLCGMSEEQQQSNIMFFKKFFRTDIANIITNLCGNFYVTVKCSVSGSTLVNLQLLDFHNTVSGYTEQSNALGGINTPIAGSNVVATANTTQLYNTVRSTIGDNMQDTGSYYKMDDVY